MIASTKQFGRAERTIGTRMLEVCAYDDGSCKGFVYDQTDPGVRPRKVAKLEGDLVSPNSARGRELAIRYANRTGEIGGYWGDAPLSPDGFRLAFAAIKEAKRKLAKFRRRNALASMRPGTARPRPRHEWREIGHVGPMRVREEHEVPESVQGRLNAAMRRDGIQPTLKTFTVTAHIGTRRSGTYHALSGASAKTAAALEWDMKPEDLTATEELPI